VTRLLIANRGEIALRIIRTATELELNTVAVYAEDDADSPHVHAADEAIALPGAGPAVYLDHAAILAAAKDSGAELIHPGYGFLSEHPGFAQACAAAGYTFVGPDAAALELFGNKSAARRAATAVGVPVLPATDGPSSVDEIRAFAAAHDGAIVIKALAGGGGRGMRIVHRAEEIDDAYRQCAAEAQLGFGDPALFAEARLADARHIEVQIVATPSRALALGDRDCSIQRRHQKLVEIAPAQGISPALRRELHRAAARLCAQADYRGIATVEFLVAGEQFVFLEVNPRIQVEHTVTEEVTGVDLVAVQLRIAQGASFHQLRLPAGIVADGDEVVGALAAVRGIAIQTRVNMETMAADGSVLPSAGTLTVFSPPSGPGVRVDTFGRPGLTPSPRYDSLLAKVITRVRGSSFSAAVRKAQTALDEFGIEGIRTNAGFLREVLSHSDVHTGPVTTDFIDDNLSAFVVAAQSRRHEPRLAPLELYPGEEVLRAQLAGTVIEVAAEGTEFPAGAPLAVLEAMKMQHVLTAPDAVRTVRALVTAGQVIGTGDPVVVFTRTGDSTGGEDVAALDLERQRADLEEVRRRHLLTLDEGRPKAITKRHNQNRRTARENIADLVDAGSFVEYGALAVAAQRSRRSEDDLIANTPADGLVAGVAKIGGVETAVLSYDYTVLAGTQGAMNHQKKDRLLKVAEEWKLPIVCFAEGGGGRPGDTDIPGVAGLDVPTFRQYAKLSGLIPRIGINSGRCFAGNAALLGCSDVIIAAANSNIGMGGPAMIEGGGLGVYTPDEVGPMSVQVPNGVVDVAVADEIEAIDVAKKYLGYFQGPLRKWEAANQKELRHLIPENRLRVYESRNVIETLADKGSVLELRPEFGPGMLTAFIRIEGEPFGLIGNNPMHLAGAIDGPCADKAARFMQLCDAFGLPIISLCDTPGFMVGPEAEKHALVRRVSRMFVIGGALSVPLFTVVLRKGYGLGAQAMAGGSFHAPFFIVSWPTGEFGGMGLEGAVRLGYRKELDAQPTPEAKEEMFKQMVAQSYARGKAINMAAHLEIDDVIDPADTRRWIMRGYRSVPPRDPNARRRSFVDTW
jgi:acetyl/propionyl-CoA carboxylase alpha subunit